MSRRQIYDVLQAIMRALVGGELTPAAAAKRAKEEIGQVKRASLTKEIDYQEGRAQRLEKQGKLKEGVGADFIGRLRALAESMPESMAKEPRQPKAAKEPKAPAAAKKSAAKKSASKKAAADKEPKASFQATVVAPDGSETPVRTKFNSVKDARKHFEKGGLVLIDLDSDEEGVVLLGAEGTEEKIRIVQV